MNIFGKLFGSDKVIDAGIKGLDAVVYTQEEKAKYKLSLLKAYEPFRVAQRFLALIFSIPYAVAWLATFVASFFADSVEAQTALLSGDVGLIVTVIVGFYFGGGAVEGVLRTRGEHANSKESR